MALYTFCIHDALVRCTMYKVLCTQQPYKVPCTLYYVYIVQGTRYTLDTRIFYYCLPGQGQYTNVYIHNTRYFVQGMSYHLLVRTCTHLQSAHVACCATTLQPRLESSLVALPSGDSSTRTLAWAYMYDVYVHVQVEIHTYDVHSRATATLCTRTQSILQYIVLPVCTSSLRSWCDVHVHTTTCRLIILVCYCPYNVYKMEPERQENERLQEQGNCCNCVHTGSASQYIVHRTCTQYEYYVHRCIICLWYDTPCTQYKVHSTRYDVRCSFSSRGQNSWEQGGEVAASSTTCLYLQTTVYIVAATMYIDKVVLAAALCKYIVHPVCTSYLVELLVHMYAVP